MKKTLTFQQPSPLPILGPNVAWLFPFIMVNSSLVGMPEQDSQTSPYQVSVKVSDILIATWGFYNYRGTDERSKSDRNNLMKVLFEYGKRHVVKKLQEQGKLDLEEKVVLTSHNTQAACPFNPERIRDPNGEQIEVEIDVLAAQDGGRIWPNTAQLRRFIIEKFTDEDLEIFCFDYFHDLTHAFTSSMDKLQKVQLLFKYCEQHSQWDDLLTSLRKTRPEQIDEHLWNSGTTHKE